MIGRAAQGRPWLFREIELLSGAPANICHRTRKSPKFTTCYCAAIWTICIDFYGDLETGSRMARKHIAWYTRGLADSASFRHAMNQLPTVDAQLAAVDAFFLGLAAQNDRLYYLEELAA
jgi:tRNA-dihydrouridine synthase B